MRRVHLLSAVGVLALTAAASGAAAQGPAQRPAASVDEVVVTAAPYGVSQSAATSSMDVLGPSDLQLAPPSSLGDVVSGLPGLRSSFFGPGAGRPVIRGLSGPRVLVLTNGIGQVDASALSPDHQVAADPGEAQRIEVLRGPAALTYGGSAIGGVVNVIDDRIAQDAPMDGMDGRLSVSGSTVDDGHALSAGAKFGKGPLVFTLDGQHRRSDDYSIPVPAESKRLLEQEGEPFEDAGDNKVANTAVDLTVYGAGISYIGANGFLGASVKRTETEYGVPGHVHEHEHEEEEEGHDHEEGEHAEGEEGGTIIDLKQTRFDLRGEWRGDLGPFDRVRFSGGHATYKHSEIEGGEVGTQFSSKGTEGRLEFVAAEQDGRQGAVGLQGLTRTLDAVGEEAYVPRTKINELGVFTMQRLDRDGWGLEGGLRLDRRQLESEVADRTFTNFSATAGVFLRPSEPWYLGLSVSRTARAPTESELFANGPHVATRGFEVGDPTLRSEVAYSLDAAAHYDAGRLSADLHLFAARYDRFIDLVPTGEEEDGLAVFAYRATDATFHGAEAELAYRVWESGDQRISFEAAGDIVRAKGDEGRLARIPPASVTGRVVYDSRRWTARAEVRRVAAQNRVATFELPTDAYTMVNASLAFRPFGDALTVFVDGRNLTDVEAREHVSFLKDLAPLPGRSIRGGIAVRF